MFPPLILPRMGRCNGLAVSKFPSDVLFPQNLCFFVGSAVRTTTCGRRSVPVHPIDCEYSCRSPKNSQPLPAPFGNVKKRSATTMLTPDNSPQPWTRQRDPAIAACHTDDWRGPRRLQTGQTSNLPSPYDFIKHETGVIASGFSDPTNCLRRNGIGHLGVILPMNICFTGERCSPAPPDHPADHVERFRCLARHFLQPLLVCWSYPR